MTDRLTDEEIEGLADRLENPGSGSAHNYMERGKLAARILRRLLAERRWRPISEAPKSLEMADLWVVVTRNGALVEEGRYCNAHQTKNGWECFGGTIDRDEIEHELDEGSVHYVRKATHFMELPDQPAQEGAE